MRGFLVVVLVGTASAADPIDPKAWGLEDASCTQVVVGPNEEEALLCSEATFPTYQLPGADEPAYRISDRYRLVVIRDQKAITLLDVATRSGVLDEVHTNLKPKRERHAVTIAKDRLSIVVGDPTDDIDCKYLEKPKLDKLSVKDREWVTLDYNLNSQICKARGTYIWKRGQFVRKA